MYYIVSFDGFDRISFEDKTSAISYSKTQHPFGKVRSVKKRVYGLLNFQDLREYNEAIEANKKLPHNQRELLIHKFFNTVFEYTDKGYKIGTKVIPLVADNYHWQELENHFKRPNYSSANFNKNWKELEFKVINKCLHPTTGEIIYHIASTPGYCHLYTRENETFSQKDLAIRLNNEKVKMKSRQDYLDNVRYNRNDFVTCREKKDYTEKIESEHIQKMYAKDRAVVGSGSQNVSLTVYYIPAKNSSDGENIWLWYSCLYDGGKEANEKGGMLWHELRKLFPKENLI